MHPMQMTDAEKPQANRPQEGPQPALKYQKSLENHTKEPRVQIANLSCLSVMFRAVCCCHSSLYLDSILRSSYCSPRACSETSCRAKNAEAVHKGTLHGLRPQPAGVIHQKRLPMPPHAKAFHNVGTSRGHRARAEPWGGSPGTRPPPRPTASVGLPCSADRPPLLTRAA